jgi:hypothetical protein
MNYGNMDIMLADQLAVLRKRNSFDDLPFQVLDMVLTGDAVIANGMTECTECTVYNDYISGHWIYFDEENDEIKVEVMPRPGAHPTGFKKLCQRVLLYLNTFEDNEIFKKCHFNVIGAGGSKRGSYF